ncbi:MAG: hypothetical protein QS98_C0010G0061 [archaeon GW2011_AR3]|nr:MAG: hypothetical protein QS98_C0010G0061 [archaeon GW2011_AR3]MBS3110199.1 hypothetical protein [Candidatus Woesearchaeota archaeon]
MPTLKLKGKVIGNNPSKGKGVAPVVDLDIGGTIYMEFNEEAIKEAGKKAGFKEQQMLYLAGHFAGARVLLEFVYDK